MTTSVAFNLVATCLRSVRTGVPPKQLRRGPGECLVVVSGLVIRFQLASFELLLIGGRHHRANTGVADNIPADEVPVAAVVRVTECALMRVREDQREERGGAGREAGCRAALHIDQN